MNTCYQTLDRQIYTLQLQLTNIHAYRIDSHTELHQDQQDFEWIGHWEILRPILSTLSIDIKALHTTCVLFHGYALCPPDGEQTTSAERPSYPLRVSKECYDFQGSFAYVRFICCEYLAREKVNLVCFFQAHRYIFILPDVTKISNAVAKCSVYIQIHLHYINNTLTYNFLQSNVVNYFKSMAKFTYTWLVCQYADPHAIFVIGQFYRSFCSFIGNGRKIFRVNWRHEF